jgi:predicted HicB family RNase H-like nuclease
MTQGTPDGWVAVVVRMPAELHAEWKQAAAAQDRSMASLVRQALRHYTQDRKTS